MRTLKTIAVAAGILAASPAFAYNCDSTSLNGNWDLYAIGNAYGRSSFTTTCRGTVASGIFNGTCKSNDAATKVSSTIQGPLTVDTSCHITGATKQYIGATVYTIYLKGTLDISHNGFSGTYTTTGGTVGLVQGARF